MILAITNSKDATADFLISVLSKSDISCLRLDTDRIVSNASLGFVPGRPTLCIEGKWFEPADFTAVWYRRPERLQDPRFESSPDSRYALDEWAEVLEGFFAHIAADKWVNHPNCNALASHKLEQLSRASRMGLNVPDTILTQDAAVLRTFYDRCKQRVIVKPLASGYIERAAPDTDSLIYTNRILPGHLEDLSDLKVCPTFFQEFIDKKQDVRITIVDNDCHAVALVACEPDGTQRCDIRRDNMSDVVYRPVDIPHNIRSILLEFVRSYRLRFAAIDMVVSTSGDWHFLEINPNGQWAWLDLTGGMNIAASFVEAFS